MRTPPIFYWVKCLIFNQVISDWCQTLLSSDMKSVVWSQRRESSGAVRPPAQSSQWLSCTPTGGAAYHRNPLPHQVILPEISIHLGMKACEHSYVVIKKKKENSHVSNQNIWYSCRTHFSFYIISSSSPLALEIWPNARGNHLIQYQPGLCHSPGKVSLWQTQTTDISQNLIQFICLSGF